MTDINLSIQFDHSAAVSRMGELKADPCLRKSRTGNRGKMWKKLPLQEHPFADLERA